MQSGRKHSNNSSSNNNHNNNNNNNDYDYDPIAQPLCGGSQPLKEAKLYTTKTLLFPQATTTTKTTMTTVVMTATTTMTTTITNNKSQYWPRGAKKRIDTAENEKA